jgi:hypothetical protein
VDDQAVPQPGLGQGAVVVCHPASKQTVGEPAPGRRERRDEIRPRRAVSHLRC